MWEAKAADGRAEQLLSWALVHAPADAELYRSADGRVVVIDRAGQAMPEAPSELVARPPHAWRFEPVRRRTTQ